MIPDFIQERVALYKTKERFDKARELNAHLRQALPTLVQDVFAVTHDPLPDDALLLGLMVHHELRELDNCLVRLGRLLGVYEEVS